MNDAQHALSTTLLPCMQIPQTKKEKPPKPKSARSSDYLGVESVPLPGSTTGLQATVQPFVSNGVATVSESEKRQQVKQALQARQLKIRDMSCGLSAGQMLVPCAQAFLNPWLGDHCDMPTMQMGGRSASVPVRFRGLI